MDYAVLILSFCVLGLGIVSKYLVPNVDYVPAILIIIAVIGLLWVFIRKVLLLCIFPGSLWAFRRSLELLYSKEISLQVFKKLEKLKSHLGDLKSNSIEASSRVDPSVKKIINTLIENLETLENKSRKQKILLNLLMSLKVNFEHIIVHLNYVEISFWKWIDLNDDESGSIFEFTLTDVNQERIVKSIKSIESIQSLLKSNFSSKNCFTRFLSYFFDFNIGTLDYMRSDLLKRFNCQEHLVDGIIDTVFVQAENYSGLAVMICNPNAGFYEFIYFQSEWLEFYLARNVNVILWNYRGYGASIGRPDFKALVDDGLSVIKYYTAKNNIKKLGLHGESIGGYVAIHLANKTKCDFLLADRTFGCLSDVIKFSYGWIAYILYKLSLFPDCENTSKFLALSCYKVLVNDPCDKIIPDYVSLKSSVAINFMLKKQLTVNEFLTSNLYKNASYILTPIELNRLSQSLSRLYYKLHFSLDDEIVEKRKIILKTESQDNAEQAQISKRLFNLFSDFNSCGVPLKSVIKHKNSEFILKIWIMTLEIWGSAYGNLENNDVLLVSRTIRELKDAISEFQQYAYTEVGEDIHLIQDSLSKISNYIQETSNRSVNSFRTEDSSLHDYSKAGIFMLVNCGHGGHYSNMNRHHLEFHLINSNFL